MHVAPAERVIVRELDELRLTLLRILNLNLLMQIHVVVNLF